jgi:hypothetical protein
VGLSEKHSFRELAAERGVVPKPYASNLEAMEAVEVMATICQYGDAVLALARRDGLAPERAEALLAELLACFARPAESAGRVIAIGKEVRGLER